MRRRSIAALLLGFALAIPEIGRAEGTSASDRTQEAARLLGLQGHYTRLEVVAAYEAALRSSSSSRDPLRSKSALRAARSLLLDPTAPRTAAAPQPSLAAEKLYGELSAVADLAKRGALTSSSALSHVELVAAAAGRLEPSPEARALVARAQAEARALGGRIDTSVAMGASASFSMAQVRQALTQVEAAWQNGGLRGSEAKRAVQALKVRVGGASNKAVARDLQQYLRKQAQRFAADRGRGKRVRARERALEQLRQLPAPRRDEIRFHVPTARALSPYVSAREAERFQRRAAKISAALVRFNSGRADGLETLDALEALRDGAPRALRDPVLRAFSREQVDALVARFSKHREDVKYNGIRARSKRGGGVLRPLKKSGAIGKVAAASSSRGRKSRGHFRPLSAKEARKAKRESKRSRPVDMNPKPKIKKTPKEKVR